MQTMSRNIKQPAQERLKRLQSNLKKIYKKEEHQNQNKCNTKIFIDSCRKRGADIGNIGETNGGDLDTQCFANNRINAARHAIKSNMPQFEPHAVETQSNWRNLCPKQVNFTSYSLNGGSIAQRVLIQPTAPKAGSHIQHLEKRAVEAINNSSINEKKNVKTDQVVQPQATLNDTKTNILIAQKTKSSVVYDKPIKIPCLEASKTANIAPSSCQTTENTQNKIFENSFKRRMVDKLKKFYHTTIDVTDFAEADNQKNSRSQNTSQNSLPNKASRKDTKLHLSNARNNIKNAWEKPKALIDSINKLNRKNSIGSGKNLANNRLKCIQKKLQEERQKNFVNESNGHLTNTSSGSNNQTTTQQSQKLSSTIARKDISADNDNSEDNSKLNAFKQNSRIGNSKTVNIPKKVCKRRRLTVKPIQNIEPMDWEPINDDNRTVCNKTTNSPTVRMMPPLHEVKSSNDLNDVKDNHSFEFDLHSRNEQNFYVTENNQSDSSNNSKEPQKNSACEDDYEDSSQAIMRDIMRDLVIQLKRDAEHESLPNFKKDCMYFVLDTNVLIDYLVFVEELTQISLCDTAGSMLYIPYVVIRELDSLKDRKDNESLRRKAVRAIRYLNTKFDESNDIQAQSGQDEYKYSIHIDNHDDCIINCCLQLKDNVTKLMLLTDDQNMCLKAKANQISVSTKSDLIAKYAEEFDALSGKK